MAEGYEPKFLTPSEITTKVNIKSGINSTASAHVSIPSDFCLLMVCIGSGNASMGIVYKYANTWYLVGISNNYATLSGSDIVLTNSYSMYKFFY